jgi:ABC-type transport system involved in multi-copper enzyme maturation permease subunit
VAGRTLRDALLIARFELSESLRTRRALALCTLFLLVALGLALAYAGAVNQARHAIGQHALLRGAASTAYEQILLWLAGGDRKVARFMAAQSPAALFLVKISTWFVPVLVMLTSAEGIARDIGTRAARYTILRTSRLCFALGKMLGQGLLVVVVLGLSAVVFLMVAVSRIPAFDLVDAAVGLLRFAPFVVCHALCFVALAALASQLVSSPALARALALLLLVGAGLLLAVPVIVWRLGLPTALGWLAELSPFAHHGLAFRPEMGARIGGVFVYLALAAIFFLLGFLRLRSRDV